MDVLAARAIQAIPNLQAAKFVIKTRNTRISYWTCEKRGGCIPALYQDDSALACRKFDAYIEPFIQSKFHVPFSVVICALIISVQSINIDSNNGG